MPFKVLLSIALLLAGLILNNAAGAACASPSDVTCSTGTELNAAGETWTSGTRYVPAGTKTMTGNITINGTGTLEVCGTLAIGTNNFDVNNNGNAVHVANGASITLTNSFYLDQDATLTLFGSFTTSNDLVANNNDATITVAGTGSISCNNLNLNQTSYMYVLSGATVSASNTMNIQNSSSVCLEDNVEMDVTKINNNVTNSFTYGGAGGGKGCIGFTGASTMNNAFTATSSIVLCEASGSTCSSCNKGSATVENPCASCSAYVLPVELLEWTASNWDNGVLLNWKTGSELNNSHFVIEASHNGKTFFPIGQSDGHGTTSEIQVYSFVDHEPKAYYRLVQYDYDGKYKTYGIRAPQQGEKTAKAIQRKNIQTWTSNQLASTGVLNQITSLTVTDLAGRPVLSCNNCGTGPHENAFDQLPSGYYHVVARGDGFTQTYRVGHFSH